MKDYSLVSALTAGLTFGLFMAISVGPTLFSVIRYSISHSYRAGIAFVLGVSLSDAIYVTIANVAAQWLQALAAYRTQISVAGGLLLIGLGLSGLLSRKVPKRPAPPGAGVVPKANYGAIWLSGFLINTLNPGVFVTWLGLVGTTIGSPAEYRVLVFGSCLLLILGIDFLKVLLADRIRTRLTLRRIFYLQKISAASIMIAGGYMLVKSVWFD